MKDDDVIESIIKELSKDDNSYMFYTKDDDYDKAYFIDAYELAVDYKRYMEYKQYQYECTKSFNVKPITENQWNKI